ncbi:TPA: RhoGAP domain-containing protein [Providencia rettgeri]
MVSKLSHRSEHAATLNTARLDSSNNLKESSFIKSIMKVRNLAFFKNAIVHLFNFHKKTEKVPKAPASIPLLVITPPDNSPKNEHVKPERVPKLAAKKIEQENIKAINYCKELSDNEKINYFQLNQLGSAILNHPNYSETIGLFRTSGNALERDKLVSHLLAGKSLKEYYLNKDIVNIKILTSAYKKIAAHLIEKNIHSLEKIPESIHNLADAVQQKSTLLKGIFAHNSINKNEQKQLSEADSKVQHAFLSLEKTPLTLQLVIPLFAEITKNQQINKMGAYNLATCFAPSLVTSSSLPLESQIKLSSDSQIYLEALINHDLKLQSYDA